MSGPHMTSLLRLAAGAGFALLALAAPAHADTQTITAHSLVLSDSLQEDTSIQPDVTLNGAVRVTMEDGLDCLTMVHGDTLVIETARCGSDSALRIEVPPGFPITLKASAGGDIKIGNIGGPLNLSVSGSGDINTGHTGLLTISSGGSSDISVGAVDGPAVLTLSGSGDVRMKSVNGPLIIKKSGSSDVAVGSVESPAVEVQNSGSGDVLLGGGTIGSLKVDINGSGDFATAATSRDAELNAHGGGDMRVGPVTGHIIRNSGGGSEIHIGTSALVGSVITDVAKAIGDDDSHRRIITFDGGNSMAEHVATLIVAGFLIYLIYRIIRRNSRTRTTARQAAASQSPPTHPGVIAVCETLARVEQRLGRVEAYVTSREFDLQQKFREMGRS
jgi:hypothetical protein